MTISGADPHPRAMRPRAQVMTELFADLKRPLVVCGFISMAVNVLLLASPLFMIQVYDRVLASRSLPTLITLTVLLAAVFVGVTLLEIVRGRMLLSPNKA